MIFFIGMEGRGHPSRALSNQAPPLIGGGARNVGAPPRACRPMCLVIAFPPGSTNAPELRRDGFNDRRLQVQRSTPRRGRQPFDAGPLAAVLARSIVVGRSPRVRSTPWFAGARYPLSAKTWHASSGRFIGFTVRETPAVQRRPQEIRT